MPKNSIQNLRDSIESASELTEEHRDQLRRIALELEKEVHRAVDASASGSDDGELRNALDLSGQLVEQTASGSGGVTEVVDDLETAVEKIAIRHPVIADFLTKLGRLV